ncbi:MAG: hypothetical protein RJB26_1339 [Pseudomonadota bacterium]
MQEATFKPESDISPAAVVAEGPAELAARYTTDRGRVLLNGNQALVRLLLLQRQRDAAAGLNTAGFVTGYRGSPLGGLDLQLMKERARLQAANVRFEPGVNEDLAATAVWGTQQLHLLPQPQVDGVFALWYAKGPGVDRAGDPIKHGNRQGTAPRGGVLLVFGDDHPGKSSTISHQSEPAVAANGLPVLYPATVQEFIELGLHGYAMSRHAGVWVGFKVVNETVEATATVMLDPALPQVVLPAHAELPPGGLHARIAFDPLSDEVRLVRHKLPAALAYARANRLDRVTHGSAAPAAGSLGIVAAGKSWLDVVQALQELGLDAARLERMGVAVYKPALIWPLEPEAMTAFARGREELLFVEEKAAFVEPQAASLLYNLPAAERPRLLGKHDVAGNVLFAADEQLEPVAIALAIAARLQALGKADATLLDRAARLRAATQAASTRKSGAVARTPYFCSGCPHNTSTKVPAGSVAMSGIGCHTLAILMDRNTLPPTQMGGEGMNWTGIAPFSGISHVFQNLGDGTYFHSGLMAVRGAVAAGVNVTYKVLYNDAVAMTGGQRVEGQLSVAEISRQLRAERVGRIVVVTDDPDKYGPKPGFAAGVVVRHRDDLEQVQRELREIAGVTAIIYDQTCAAEKRRRRKRGTFPDPDRRVLINELVCEGCGDCSVQANCLSIEPLETEFGRKRRIDQNSCNKDYSCAKGFCPSFVSVRGGTLRKPETTLLPEAWLQQLPEPTVARSANGLSVLVTGIGGTGVVTVGAVLTMAAHLDGMETSAFDMTGLAQKGGAVFSHLKFARPGAARIGLGEADVVIGCDLVVTASEPALRTVDAGRTQVVYNTHLTPTAALQRNPDVDFHQQELAGAIDAAVGLGGAFRFDGTGVARQLLGDTTAANLLLVGYALQMGWLPVSRASLERAIELNGAAVKLNLQALRLGRCAAHHRTESAAQLLKAAGVAATAPSMGAVTGGTTGVATGMSTTLATTLAQRIDIRAAFLVDYQSQRLAQRYRRLVEDVATREAAVLPGSTQLAEAVAQTWFRLLAFKDEYEVARLHATRLAQQVEATFAGDYRLSFHLAPPLFASKDPATGLPRKREFGPWIVPAFRALAKLRFLRGTWFDPFGYTAERQTERQLIADFESAMAQALPALSAANLAVLLEWVRVHDSIRGFGHVKAANLEKARARWAGMELPGAIRSL